MTVQASTNAERGVTFNFTSPVDVGSYAADGQYAVNGVLASTSPASTTMSGTDSSGNNYTGRVIHGLMVNPGSEGGTGLTPPQGFDSMPNFNGSTELVYDASLNRDPGANGGATVSGVCSLVKSISVMTTSAGVRNKLDVLAFCDLVSVAPPSGSFRRWPGAASRTPLFNVSDIDWTALPSVALPSGATLPDPDVLISALGPMQTFGNNGLFNRGESPNLQQSGYGADIANDINRAILYCFTAGVPTVDRNRVAIKLIQIGLDLYDALEAGRRWSGSNFSFGGAHQWLKTPLAFAAKLMRNAAASTDVTKMLTWLNFGTRPVWGDDLMMVVIDRRRIEAVPKRETQTGKIGGQGYGDHMENAAEARTKPSSLAGSYLYDDPYRPINGSPLMVSTLIARLFGFEVAYNNPLYFTYMDRYFNEWVRRGSRADNGYLDTFGSKYLTAYYAANSPLLTSGTVPALVRAVARNRTVWLEFDRNLDVGFHPAETDFAVTVAGSPVTLTPRTTTATYAVITDKRYPTMTVASATGIYVGMRVTAAGFVNPTYVTSVVGNVIGVSNNPISAGSNVAVTFSPVAIFGKSLAVVLPTPLTPATSPTFTNNQAVTIAYTPPGTNFARSLGGAAAPAVSAMSAANYTGALPQGATVKATAYSGTVAATRQYSGTDTPASSPFRRLRLSMRFVLSAAMAANDIIASSNTGSTGTFKLYASTTSNLRLFLPIGIFTFTNALVGLPINKLLTLHLFFDGTAVTAPAGLKAAIVHDAGGGPVTVTTSVVFDGTLASNIVTAFPIGLFLGSNGSGSSPLYGGIQEFTLGWGDDTYPLPADFSGGSFAYNADWGANGELIWGDANQWDFSGSIAEWNAGLNNRGNGGSFSLALQRGALSTDGEFTPSTQYSAPGGAPTAYTVTALSAVNQGTPLTVTVTLDAPATAALSVTVIASGVAGSMSGSPISFTIGQQVGSCTFTPSASGTLTLNATNNAALTDPAAQVVAVTSPGTTPTSITPSVVSSSLSGFAPVPVTFTLDKTAVQQVIVTPTTTDPVGFFVPDTLVIPIGATAAVASYLPRRLGTATVSSTNDRALANSSPLTLTVGRMDATKAAMRRCGIRI